MGSTLRRSWQAKGIRAIFKVAKCEFGVNKIGFLGYVIHRKSGYEGDRVASIQDWPTPGTLKDVQVFLDL